MTMSAVSSSVSWVYDKSFSWIHRMGFYILKWGAVPKHVAIIMDGNRRFAQKTQVRKVEGHEKGFNKLTETLQWCLDMDIFEVTVYAFSIENFKRSKNEVEALMDLAKHKFRALIEEWEKLQEHGICVRVIGNLTLLPKDVLVLILVAMLLTKDNKRAYLNIAFSYTGKEEMTSTSGCIVHGLRNGQISDGDLSKSFVEQCMYTYQSPPPELVIRTSGEHRISDFLSWQSSRSYIHFVNVLWPEFSAWNLMFAVFCYQHFVGRLMKPFQNHYPGDTENALKFVDTLHKEQLCALISMCKCKGEQLDWGLMSTMSRPELYNYYRDNIYVPSGEVSG